MRQLGIIATFVFLMCSLDSSAQAFITINGDVSDWGISLASGAINFLDGQTPSGGFDIDYIMEDNAQNPANRNYTVGPGVSAGNQYDAEAMFLDNDAHYLYLAIITGVSPIEATHPAGDIFFSLDPVVNNQYAFGIDISSSQLLSVSSWLPVKYSQHSSANPWAIGTGNYISDVDFVYTTTPVNDHYVMEARIALADIGWTGEQDQDIWVHWTMECGNDILDLPGDINVIPEPMTMSLLGMGLLGIFGLRRKRV